MPRKNQGKVIEVMRPNGKKVLVARFRYLDDTGKQREKSKVVENKTVGGQLIDKWQADFKMQGKKAFSSNQTFLEFSEWFAGEYLIDAERSDSGAIVEGRKSIKPVKSQLKALQNFFGKMPVKEIEYHDLVRYKRHRLTEPVKNSRGETVIKGEGEERKPKKRKPSTIRREMSLMSQILKKAQQQRLITRNPFADGEPLFDSKVEVERIRVLSRTEQDALLSACDVKISGRDRKHLKSLILFAANTGMRRGEILKLTWNFVNLEHGYIVLPFEITKTESERIVPILEELKPLLEEMQAQAKSNNHLIFAEVGDFKRAWATAKRIAGITDLRFHDLRASFATRMMFEKKIPSDVIRKVTGHKTSRVFDRYIRPEADDLVKQFRSGQ